ncbi:hypothetical protein D9O50_00375 [Oxalobacteraceae bacterium CAVE-383]|nr:hypothetical protein D9O50_00375 [Oxalobacteraceae bacterium CAVE-383]
MAITIPINDPLEFLQQFKADITAQRTDEWVWDADGDITLSHPEYRSKAWFRPYPKSGKLVFAIIPASEPKMTRGLSAYYHGRLLETLLARYQNEVGETMISSVVSKFYDL